MHRRPRLRPEHAPLPTPVRPRRRPGVAWPLAGMLGALLLVVGAPVAEAQVETEDGEVSLLIAGDLYVDGVRHSALWSSGGARDEFASVWARLSFELRLTPDTQALIALQNQRHGAGLAFGTGINAARGQVIGADDARLEIDEAYLRLKRLFNQELDLTIGQQHLRFGLQTGIEDVWEGHGAIWFDSRFGRGGASSIGGQGGDWDPIGLTAQYKLPPGGTLGGLQLFGGAYLLRKDFAPNPEGAVMLAGVWASWSPEPNATVIAGFTHWGSDFDADFQTTWFGSSLKVSEQLTSYAELYIQTSEQFSGIVGHYVGSTLRIQQNAFIDVSWWRIAGNDPTTAADDAFRATDNVADALIVESADFGAGRNNNYEALKIIVGYELSYNFWSFVRYSTFSALEGNDTPGNEFDLVFRLKVDEHTTLEATAAYLSNSSLLAGTGETRATLFVLSAHMQF